jgi:CheY-like chemotaxis protein
VTGRYVLVVDDHPMNVKLMQQTLDLFDLPTRVARDADEVMAQLEAGLPGLILMDVQLPGTDGLTLTRRLRADPRYATIPIVAVTAYAMASDEQAALDAGCNGFVAKPIDVMKLANMAKRYLEDGER